MNEAARAGGRMPAAYRLAGFYFAYFSFNGIFSAYWGLYLKALSFAAWQIGVLMSLQQIMRIVGPNLWGWLADRIGRRAAIIRFVGLASVVSFVGVLIDQRFGWLLLSLALMSFFWSGSLPLVEATTLTLLDKHTHRYGRIRLWGSIGFIVAALGMGYLLEWTGIRALPWFILSTMMAIALYGWFIPDVEMAGRHEEAGPLWDVLRQPAVIALFLACFFMALAHGPYYSFFSIYLEEGGHGKRAIGYLWSIGVIAEVVAFLVMPRLAAILGWRRLFLIGLALAVLRFLLIAWVAASLSCLVFAQLLHAATFGSHHAASMAFIHRFFTGRHQARGQALYICASFGLGGSLGGLAAGALWRLSGGTLIYGLSSLAAMLGLLIAWRWLRVVDN